jgi:hypothetical protein
MQTGQTGYSETSVQTYRYSLRNSAAARSSQLLHFLVIDNRKKNLDEVSLGIMEQLV